MSGRGICNTHNGCKCPSPLLDEFLNSLPAMPTHMESTKMPTKTSTDSPDCENLSDPLLNLITLHEGDETWHDGPGWYFTIDDYPDEGSFGAFASASKCMEAAEDHVEL